MLMAVLSKDESAVAKQHAKLQEAKAAADSAWAKVDRETSKLVRAAKLGRKSLKIVRISENRGLRVPDRFRTAMREKEDKVFAPAFARRFEVKEVPLDTPQ